MSDRLVKPVLMEDVALMNELAGVQISKSSAIVGPIWAWMLGSFFLGILLGIVF